MKICIIDDHEIVREGLRRVLTEDPALDIVVVGEASSGATAMELLRRVTPDVALVDFRLPDTTGDILCARIRQVSPRTKVVVLTTYLAEDVVQRCLDAGAQGFVTKASGLDELHRVLHSLREGGETTVRTSSSMVKGLREAEDASGTTQKLTPQQQRVLDLAASGSTYSEIGRTLHISESTVRFHIQRLKDLLGARTKTELLATAIRSALISPDRFEGRL